MWLSDEIVLKEFERVFTQWLQIKAELSADLRSLYAQPEKEQPDLCLMKAQKALLQALFQTLPSAAVLTRHDSENLTKMRFALAAYWDDFLLQRFNWIDLPDPERQQLRKTWLKYLVEWEAFGTRSAGRRFPEAVHALAFAERREDADTPLLMIYYRILWLGFGDQTAASRQRTQELMDKIHALLQARMQPIAATQHSQPLGWMPPAGMKPGRLAPIKQWQKLLLVGFTGVAASSLLMWIGIVLHLTSNLAAMN